MKTRSRAEGAEAGGRGVGGRLTWRIASSPRSVQLRVGDVARRPLSVTSSTVSPIDSTSVAFTKDTTMYLKTQSNGV